MAAARYNTRLRTLILGYDYQDALNNVSGFLAIAGLFWAIIEILYDLSTFTMPLMPLLAIYILVWPACMLSYLTSDRHPTIANVIFPFPRAAYELWLTFMAEFHQGNRSNRP
jgi:hypothetical protein